MIVAILCRLFFKKNKSSVVSASLACGWRIVASLVVISVRDGNSVERSDLEAIADHKDSMCE